MSGVVPVSAHPVCSIKTRLIEKINDLGSVKGLIEQYPGEIGALIIHESTPNDRSVGKIRPLVGGR